MSSHISNKHFIAIFKYAEKNDKKLFKTVHMCALKLCNEAYLCYHYSAVVKV